MMKKKELTELATLAKVAWDAGATAILGEQRLRLSAIQTDPGQPRKTFDETSLEELAASIRAVGIIQPLLVEFVPQNYTLHEPDLTCNDWTLLDRKGVVVKFGGRDECEAWCSPADLAPYYRLVCGERRLRAAELAGLAEVPCTVRAQLEDREKYKIQIAENKDREALPALDEAASYHDAVVVRKLFTAEELAKELGKSRSHVFARLKLATVPAAIRDAVAGGKLNAALAELVARVPGEKNQVKAMKEILDGGEKEYPEGADGYTDYQNPIKHAMSVREATDHLRRKYTLDLESAVFDIKDKELLPSAGACKDCPKRSGNCVTEFPELAKNPDVCTDPDCYQKKVAAHIEAARQKAEANGLRVLTAKEAKPLFRWGNDINYGVAIEDLNAKVAGDKQKRTYKQLLGKDAPAQVVAIAPDGSAHTIYQKELIEAALEQKGFKFDRAAQGESPEVKAKRERQHATRVKLGGELLLKALVSIEKTGNSEKELASFLRLLLTLLDGECREQVEKSSKRRKLKLEKAKWTELKGILVESLIIDSYGGRGTVNWHGDFTKEITAVCEFAGIDLKAQEKLALEWAEKDAAIDAKHPIKEEEKPKSKPAKKKGGKK